MKRKATKLLSAAMSAVVLLSNGAVYASEEQQNKEKTVDVYKRQGLVCAGEKGCGQG